MALGNTVPGQDDAVAMDVDRVDGGKGKKGKSKGKQNSWKGKGKGDSKGKGKDSFQSGKGKSTDGKGKSMQWTTNQNSWNKGWNKGKQSGKSDGKGGKASSKGKGKAACFNCGSTGHFARDCKVRAVNDQQQSEDVNRSAASATSYNSSSCQQSQQSSSSNQQTNRVNRVAFDVPVSHDVNLVFDVTRFDDFSNLRVAMVSEGLQQCAFSDDAIPAATTSESLRLDGLPDVSTGFHAVSDDLSWHATSFEPYLNNVCNEKPWIVSDLQNFTKEFSQGKDDSDSFASFELCSLFQLDDMDHFAEMVSRAHSLELYERTVEAVNQLAMKRFDDSSCFKPLHAKHQTQTKSIDNPFGHEVFDCFGDSCNLQFNVCAVSDGCEIVLDSGSDATVIPMSVAGAGKPSVSQSSFLRDAQGSQIDVSSVRDINVVLHSMDGRCITFRDRGHVSSKVDQPLLSFGKLLRHGWSIVAGDNGSGPVLGHECGAKIPISFRNHSVTVHGEVRMVEDAAVRVISVDIPRSWQRLRNGWYTMEGESEFPMCVSGGSHFVDTSQQLLVTEYPYRTTVAYNDNRGWEIIELCERVFPMDDKAAKINERYQSLITLASTAVLSPSEFGMVVLDDAMQGGASGSAGGGLPAPSSAVSSEAQRPQAQPMEQSSMERRAVPESVAVQQNRDVVTVAGVQVTKDAAISVLRAACGFLQVSQSGSKSKLWSRIVATLDKQLILEEKELSDLALQESTEPARPVHSAQPPSEEEIKSHNLTHLPYKDWCSACNMAKARPDAHRVDPDSLKQRETPVISFDYCHTGKTGEAVEEGAQVQKLTAVVVHDSHSNAVHCVPVRGKHQGKHVAKEIIKFINFLGYGSVCLRTDNEPATLDIQRVIQRARQRQNLRTVIENGKVLDKGSNPHAEKAIDRVRCQAMVFLHALTNNIKYDVPPGHPLFAWAFVHAAWTLTRFSLQCNVSAYQLIAGHPYHGKLCDFGAPVMIYVGDSNKHKGDPKWRHGIFLGKNMSNDMYIASVSGNLRLSRSIKSIFPVWSEHMEHYRQIAVFPWQTDASFGNKIETTNRRELRDEGMPQAFQGIDDEAASDPEDDVEAMEVMPSNLSDAIAMIPPLTPLPAEVQMPAEVAAPVTPDMPAPRRLPPPPSAVVSGQVSADHPSMVTTSSAAVSSDAATTEHVGGGMGAEQVGQSPTNVATEPSSAEEPSAKRPRVLRVDDVEMHHMDVDPVEFFDSECMDSFNQLVLEDAGWHVESETMDASMELDTECLWKPFSALEPVLDQMELQTIDEVADKVEIQRLQSMGVIINPSNYSGTLGKELSAKMVRTWRKKTRVIQNESGEKVEIPAWMRRSRMVAREFAFLEQRDDIYSPSSCSAVTKVLPALALSNGFVKDGILGTADISDAYLQVPQRQPRVVKLGDLSFVILKCLPGQRDGALLWYQHFVSVLDSKMKLEVCQELPCLLKCGSGAILLHVDDLLFHGTEEWATKELIPHLESEFKISYTYAPRHEGGSFEFLKRLHVIAPNYETIVIHPEAKHVNTMVERFALANGKPAKLSKTPCLQNPAHFAANSPALSDWMSSEYRSLVGIAMYMAQERYDIQFATKTLACDLKAPTEASWVALGRLVGYLRFSKDFAFQMCKTQKGQMFMETLNNVETERAENVVEVYSDSDWNGGTGFKSTSSAMHVLNGLIVHSTSRSQKAISLSSTEAEWYAGSAATCDSLFLRNIVQFLTGDVQCVVLHVDNSAVRNVAAKLGVGRLRHISGRMMWMQQMLRAKEIETRQVSTTYNIADLNTKGLTRERFFALLWMIGYVDTDGRVGEREYTKMQTKAVMKSQINVVNRVINSELGNDGAKLPHLSSISKQVLRVLATYSLLTMAEAAQVAEALSLWLTGRMGLLFLILIAMVFWFASVCFMVPGSNDEPENEPDTFSLVQSLQEHGTYNEALVYCFITACVGRIENLRSTIEPEMETQLSTLEQQLLECFKSFERNGFNSTSVDRLLATVQQFSTVDQDFRVQKCAHQEFMLTGDEPELEEHIPDEMPEEYRAMTIPPPFEHNSPEHMAQWMFESLSKRLVKHVEAGNVQKVKVYVERRKIMLAVLNTCQRDPTQRINALYMMNSILDISDDESENTSSNTTGPSTVHSPSV